jgi:hypothetical protein
VHLTITDTSAKIFAWCVGQTAVEFLQISPDEYMELPEVWMKTCPVHHKNIVFALASGVYVYIT